MDTFTILGIINAISQIVRVFTNILPTLPINFALIIANITILIFRINPIVIKNALLVVMRYMVKINHAI